MLPRDKRMLDPKAGSKVVGVRKASVRSEISRLGTIDGGWPIPSENAICAKIVSARYLLNYEFDLRGPIARPAIATATASFVLLRQVLVAGRVGALLLRPPAPL